MLFEPANHAPFEFCWIRRSGSGMFCSFDDPKFRMRSAGPEQFNRMPHRNIRVGGSADQQHWNVGVGNRAPRTRIRKVDVESQQSIQQRKISGRCAQRSRKPEPRSRELGDPIVGDLAKRGERRFSRHRAKPRRHGARLNRNRSAHRFAEQVFAARRWRVQSGRPSAYIAALEHAVGCDAAATGAISA